MYEYTELPLQQLAALNSFDCYIDFQVGQIKLFLKFLLF